MEFVTKPIRFVGIFLMFSIIGLSFLAEIPLAMAEPDPGLGAFPPSVETDGTTAIVVVASSAVPQNGEDVTVYDQAASPTDNNVCPTPVPGGGGVPITVAAWRLTNPAGTIDIRYYLPTGPIPGPSSTISAPFGTAIGSSIITVTGANGALLTNDGTDPASSGSAAASVLAKWTPLAPGPSTTPNTSRLGVYALMTCGMEAPATTYEIVGSLTTTPPVAGEIIPINTTALLIAGFSNQASILVTLVFVAIGSFIVLKFKVGTKSIN